MSGLGLTKEDKLAACPESPNCVCSDTDGSSHGIEPLIIEGDPLAAWATLLGWLENQPRFTITVRESNYIRAEARTALLRFVDDVEFHLRPQTGEIAMRSASRVGYSDMGTNRRRLESVRTALAEAGVVNAPN